MSGVDLLIFLITTPTSVIALTTFFSILLYRQKRRKKMYALVEEVLDDYVLNIIDGKIEKLYLPEYDYVVTTNQTRTYIMVVPNYSAGELFLSSSTKWSIKKNYEDYKSKFVPRVDKLARFDPPFEKDMTIRRMYIIYPEAKSILRYINDCEMEFIHSDSDINGASIVTYLELKDKKIIF